jgi:Domain of unknown function (DUF4296)
MIRFTFIILMALSMTIYSCETRRSKLGHKNLIPENELVTILADIYMTDGLIGMPRIIMKYSPLDSISTYNKVIEKHGYTREAVDKSIKYYFIKDPKRLIKIYDKVLGILSEMESRVQKDILKSKVQTGSLWPGPESFSFPDPSGTDSALFDISFNKSGYYTLTVTVTLFPDDQTIKPGLTAFTCHPDSLETGKRKYIKPLYYIKDGLDHIYNVHFTVPVNTSLRVRGSLYDFLNHPDDWEKHLVIKKISAIYSLVPK